MLGGSVRTGIGQSPWFGGWGRWLKYALVQRLASIAVFLAAATMGLSFATAAGAVAMIPAHRCGRQGQPAPGRAMPRASARV